MFERLFQSIQEKVAITPEELDLCASFFIPKKFKKKQVLLQENEICVYNTFVEKGILRSFYRDEKGNEHTVQFAIEGWWITDLFSFLTSTPSVYTIEALEDSDVLLLTTSAREALMDKIPMFEKYQRLLLQNAYIANQSRINSAKTETAEQKYTHLVMAYPGLMQRVPQHMIASYLGLKPETISRVRKHINERPSL